MNPIPGARAAVTVLFVGLIAASWALGNGSRGSLFKNTGDPGSFGFVFREISKEAGVDFVHRAPVFDKIIENVMPDIASMGAAVAVCDPNGDGWPDLYITNSEFGAPNALYINQSGVNQETAKFIDIAKEAGVADLNKPGEGASMGSIWGDFDNDGLEDVFIYKYGHTQLFKNQGAAGGSLRFVDITKEAGVRRWMNSNTACWIDYNRDGLIDLYVAGYFRDEVDLWNLKSTKFRQESMEFANNGGHNYLYKNLGGGKFADVTAEAGVDTTRWTLAVAAADFNNDGWPDLYLANDFGSELLFLNQEGKRFEAALDAGLSATSKSGMAVTVGDCNNTGNFDVYVTNITKGGFLAQGNNLRMNKLLRTGRFTNVANGDVADCGWAWGAQFGDFNNDGAMDLFVANGYISASRERDYWYDMSRVGSGAGDLIEDSAHWAPFGDKSLSGYERSRVLVNDGIGGFVDAATAAGVNDLLDGRAVVLADLFRTGSLDIIVANQKDRLLIYKNNVDAARQWIQIKLEATKSNRSAIGASVLLEWESGGEKKMQRQQIDGGGGFSSQNEKKLHFGLGANVINIRATVRWPSGVEQRVDNLTPRQIHTIREL
ncbi:MAG: CRTAC1 family protein [Planctomycetota bacterium]